MSDVAQAKTLEQRITERLHASIGELMTDDDLRAIVERGVEEALFQPKRTPRTYGGGYDTTPALVDRLVEKHLQERMEAAVNAWIAEHPDELRAAVDRAIQAGVADALIRTLDNRFRGIFTSGVEYMQQNGMLPRLGS